MAQKLGVFDKLLLDLNAADARKRTMFSWDWYRNKAKELAKQRNITAPKLLNDRDRTRGDITIGRMYLFSYDPKHKAKLPYYDRYPLIIPVDGAEGGFYGLNLHYLGYKQRGILFDNLMAHMNGSGKDEKTRIKLDYMMLKGASDLPGWRPCFKRYLSNHVEGEFLRIDSFEWNAALFLPVEKFVKKSSLSVWAKSRTQLDNIYLDTD